MLGACGTTECGVGVAEVFGDDVAGNVGIWWRRGG